MANKAYKLYLYQVNTGKVLFANGETDNSKFLKGAETAAAGLDFYAEVIEGGYRFYTTIDGAKKYLDAHTETSADGKVSKFLNYTDSTTNVWYYKAETNSWYVTLDGAEYVMGTYNTFNTLSMSDSKFMTAENTGKTQFPGSFVAKEVAEAADFIGKVTGNAGGSETPDVPGTPDTPTTGEGVNDLAVNTPYYIYSTCGQGTNYFSGSLGNGRIDGTIDKAQAVAVKLEAGATAGEYYIYFMDGNTKTYIGANSSASSKTAAFTFTATKDDSCIWILDSSAKTIMSKAFSGRGIATKTAETRYTNFSTYASSNFGSAEYQAAWFMAA